MVTAASEPPYHLVPNLRANDPSIREVDRTSHTWVQATIIEDDDLMFGGKSLSALYEEERQRISGSAEEERRGRQRFRQHDLRHGAKAQQVATPANKKA